MRKPALKWMAGLLCVALAAVVGWVLLRQQIMERLLPYGIKKVIQRVDDAEELLDPGTYPGLRVILAGTGTPLADAGRSHPCTAVIANGEFLVFDDGGGGLRQLQIDRYPTHRITRAFLTHMHSDHMGGVGKLINSSWIYGRKEAFHIHGPKASNLLTHSLYPPTSEEYLHGTDTTGGVPDRRRIDELTEDDLIPGVSYIPGVEHMVEGLSKAYEPDIIIRSSNKQMPPGHYDPSHAYAIAHAIPDMDTSGAAPDFGWGELETVYTSDDGKLLVKAFLVDHYPCFPSYGYRVEYAGRAVVITGDTEKLTYMATCAQGADLLIHEAMNMELVERVTGVLEDDFDRHVWAAQARAAASHHTDRLDVARAAEDAGAATLVLTHVGPPTPNDTLRRMFVKGMDDIYHGRIVLGEDGMEFYLDPIQKQE